MWQGLTWLRSQGIVEMAKSRTFGSLAVQPYGFVADGWLRYQWDSISVQFPGGTVRLTAPKIVLRLATTAPDYEHIRLHFSSIDIHLDPKRLPKDTTTREKQWTFPDLSLLIRVYVVVDSTRIDVQKIGQWQIFGLVLNNSEKRNASISTEKIIGTHVPHPVSARLSASWSGHFLESAISLHAGSDSVFVRANAPLEKLSDLSGQVHVAVANPRYWIPFELPAKIPSITGSTVQCDFHADLKKKRAQWSHTIHSKIGPVAVLPDGALTVQGSGEFPGTVRSNILWEGSTG
jgi:hypothetical protein